MLMVWTGLLATQDISHTDLHEQQLHPHSVTGIVQLVLTTRGAAGRQQSFRARKQVFSFSCCLST